MVLNSLSLSLSVKLLISSSYLNEVLAGYSNLVCRLFSFITLSMYCHSLLACRVSTERSAVILMGIPLKDNRSLLLKGGVYLNVYGSKFFFLTQIILCSKANFKFGIQSQLDSNTKFSSTTFQLCNLEQEIWSV